MNQLKELFIEELKIKQDNYENQIRILMEEDRVDEANLEKIKFNVVDIFTKMFHVCLKKTNDINEFQQEYLQTLNKIMSPWNEKREKANQFGDTIQVIVEDIKLEEANQIIDLFSSYVKRLC